MSLAISHHKIPCKNKLDVLYFVVACFTWLLWVSRKNDSYLCKATTVISKLLFNLLQGSPLSNPIQLRWERQTPASHLYATKLHVSRWNRSHVRGHVKLVWATSSHNTAESRKDQGRKQSEYQCPQTPLCSTHDVIYARPSS
jgi:hypothetical protein